MEEKDREVHISVRGLVEFILRSGDIDNRRAAGADNAMQEGSRIHRMLQKRMGADYRAEVPLKYCYRREAGSPAEAAGDAASAAGSPAGTAEDAAPAAGSLAGTAGDAVPAAGSLAGTAEDAAVGNGGNTAAFSPKGYSILIEGRADGILENAQGVVIDEIKGTYRELKHIKEPVAVHLAQAKCYAFIYGEHKKLFSVGVRMTYCNMDTEDVKYFHFDYTLEELKAWFEEVLDAYGKWADFQYRWRELRQASVKALTFPFPYRKGQKELITYVYQTVYHKRKLFVEAPTGVGKTLSTVFPALKSMGEGRGERIFYLTAKTITRTVADDTFELLRREGLRCKTVLLTARDKICFMDEAQCNPEYCPYAKGHYDRVNEAMYDLLTHEDNFNRDRIEEYALKHNVCPFELGLDMSLFSDAVICDYNYVFDPHVYLKRFFAEGVRGDYLFLIDEAHNLVERGREMYSAALRKEDFLLLKNQVKEYDRRLAGHLEKCNKEMLSLKRECVDYRIEESASAFVMALQRLHTVMEELLEEQEKNAGIPEDVRGEILDFYFEVCHFLDMYERVDENYVIYSELCRDGSFILRLFCVNPSVNLKECMKKGRSTILFSATLLPIRYYKDLLGAEEEDYEVYAESVFDPEKRGLFIGSDVTSRYSRRSDMEYYNIAAYIYEIVKNRHGNYLIFFPSHAFLQQVYAVFEDYFLDEEQMECILQGDHMNEKEREEFLCRFSFNNDCDFSSLIRMDIEIEEEKSLLGFCVLGGIFSEGIDLKNDSLIGAVIVGTGLPQVCIEREILKKYFDEAGGRGFDYAYLYPGMNKVLQAAGRVIRTAQDVGIVALLDERFLNRSYQRLFPREWQEYEAVTVDRVARRVERFWNEWL